MALIRTLINDDQTVDANDLAQALSREVSSRKLVVIFCRCEIEYRGRSRSLLPEGDRLIIIKTNHSVIVHRPTGYSPVNWQPDSSKISFHTIEQNGKKILVMTSVRDSPREYLWVKIRKVYQAVSAEGMVDEAKFSMYVSEKEVKDYLEKNPHIIEEGMRIIAREYRTKVGIIDLLGVDRENNLVVIEVKDEKASLEAAKQLYRYVKHVSAEKGEQVRGILVAPGVTHSALDYLEKHSLEKVVYDPSKLMEEYLKMKEDEGEKRSTRPSKKLTDFF